MADLIDRKKLLAVFEPEARNASDLEAATVVGTIKAAPAVDPLSRLRLKYGWHDAAKILPSHSRHVLIWTNRGEFRAYYDHVHDCWRTTRDGLKITHWREQCGPENWPAAE